MFEWMSEHCEDHEEGSAKLNLSAPMSVGTPQFGTPTKATIQQGPSKSTGLSRSLS